MRKPLLGLAIAAAGLAPAAMAQTGDPITLYGRVYVTFESVEADGQQGAPEVARRNRVSDNSSMFGIRGSERLGDGLSAFFQLETQFKPDQNDTTFANRNSGVGLRGAWGSVLLGRWDTPFKATNGNVDAFDDFTIGAYSMALQGSGVAGVNGQFNRRDQNVVQYWSPRFADFEVRLSYSANEAKTDTTDPQSQGASIIWAKGPIYVGYAYHELKDQTFGVYSNTALVQPPVLVNATVTVGKQTGNSIFGTFKIGPVKLGADYQEFKRTNPVQPAAVGPGTVVGFEKQKAWMGNIVWTVGQHQFIYQYLETKGGGQQSLDPAYTPQSPKCDVNAVGYQYNFSKRTFVLAQYLRVRNNATSTCTLGQNPLTIVAGQDPEGASIGVKHVF